MKQLKNILVASNHLNKIGGSETFTYTIIEELVRRNYNVEYFTFKKGITSDYIEQLGVSFLNREKYDLILASHCTCVNFLHKMGPIIQTCHGIFPDLEQPSPLANIHISISEEVSNYLIGKGYNSKIIANGINLSRYYSKTEISNTLTNVLSLSQSESANIKIRSACKKLQLNLKQLNKNENSVWKVEEIINQADLVIGLGRSAYEALACGRPLIIYDERHYSQSAADGYVQANNLEVYMKNNCSGRHSNLNFTTQDIIDELQKYNKDDGQALRKKAESILDIKISIDKYLETFRGIDKRPKKLKFKDFYTIYKIKKMIKRQ